MLMLTISLLATVVAIAVLATHAIRSRKTNDPSLYRLAGEEAQDAIRELSRLNSIAAASLEQATGHLAAK